MHLHELIFIQSVITFFLAVESLEPLTLNIVRLIRHIAEQLNMAVRNMILVVCDNDSEIARDERPTIINNFALIRIIVFDGSSNILVNDLVLIKVPHANAIRYEVGLIRKTYLDLILIHALKHVWRSWSVRSVEGNPARLASFNL